jgi:hypothetical protein
LQQGLPEALDGPLVVGFVIDWFDRGWFALFHFVFRWDDHATGTSGGGGPTTSLGTISPT